MTEAEKERAAIVEMLQRTAVRHSSREQDTKVDKLLAEHTCGIIHAIIKAIESGDHLK